MLLYCVAASAGRAQTTPLLFLRKQMASAGGEQWHQLPQKASDGDAKPKDEWGKRP